MDYLFGALEAGVFIHRDNRFRAEIELEGNRFKAHIPNSGRMGEILTKGNKVWIRKVDNPNRKTPYDLVLVEANGETICLDSHLANTLFEIWLKKGYLTQFGHGVDWQKEVSYGQSRIDFLVRTADGPCLVEVKSVNLVVNGQGKFPDAPTQRGAKHLEELMRYKDSGLRSAVVFILLRADGDKFLPNDITDPCFGDTLRKAVKRGVEVYAYKSQISTQGVKFLGPLPVEL